MDKTALKKHNTDLFAYLLIGLSAILLTSFVCPYAPWFRYCFETDESVYRIVSLGWLRGKLPYRDLFDHKGPLTYVFYAAGLLISAEKSWGMWIIFCLINSATFITMYRTFRLLYNEKTSLLSSETIIFLLTLSKDPLFSTGTKPEHICLMFLMLSTYIFVRAVKSYSVRSDADRDTQAFFSCSDILKIGLCCGCVFMIKFNICIFYLVFIGAFFLWLLIRKKWLEFFSRVSLFLCGILSITAVFVLYYKFNDGLTEFINTYFVFNIRYGGTGHWQLHIFQSMIPLAIQLVTLLLIFLSAGVAYHSVKNGSPKKLQSIVSICLGAIVYLFISSPELYKYKFVVLLPLYMYGLPYVIQILLKRRQINNIRAFAITLFVVPVILSCLINFFLIPFIPKEPNEFEQKMISYSESHPQATYLFFMSNTFASPMFYDLTTEVPSFRYYFVPPRDTEEMETEQLKTIARGQADVIVIRNPDGQNQEVMQSFYDFFELYGYSYYCEGDGYEYDNDVFYLIYTKKEPVS